MQLTSFSIALETKHDFRSPVPSRGNIFRHVTSILLGVNRKAPRETEVADLKFAVGINEQVTGLQVSVEDVCGVDIFQSTQNLVDKRLEVGIGQRLTTNNCR